MVGSKGRWRSRLPISRTIFDARSRINSALRNRSTSAPKESSGEVFASPSNVLRIGAHEKRGMILKRGSAYPPTLRKSNGRERLVLMEALCFCIFISVPPLLLAFSFSFFAAFCENSHIFGCFRGKFPPGKHKRGYYKKQPLSCKHTLFCYVFRLFGGAPRTVLLP